jgi:hypothetical protein
VALLEQDEKMRIVVETRLTAIQEDFLERTEISAQQIFDENHKHVLGSLSECNNRVDEVVSYHKAQKDMHEELFH